MTDPFSLVYTALCDMIRDELVVNQSVAVIRNIIRFDDYDNRDPLKQHVADSDLPEISIFDEGLTGNIHQTSSSTSVIRRYRIAVSTGDFRNTTRLYPVEWALFRSFPKWKTALTSVKWNEKPFVKRFNIVDATEGESDKERNRGITGWSALWRIEIEMHFRTGDL